MSLSAHGTKEKESLEEYLSHDATDRIAKEQVKRAFESFRSSYDAMSHKLRISMKREQTLLEKVPSPVFSVLLTSSASVSSLAHSIFFLVYRIKVGRRAPRGETQKCFGNQSNDR